MTKQLTEKEAVALFESGKWKNWTDKERAMFQIYQDRLCMPFKVFHVAVGNTLGRPVWTHEFANRNRLAKELESVK